MPVFMYEAMNASGQEVKEEIDAANSQEAIAKIRAKGYFPTKVREKAQKKKPKGDKKGAKGAKPDDEFASAPRRKMPFSIMGVKRKQLVNFTRQLSTMYSGREANCRKRSCRPARHCLRATRQIQRIRPRRCAMKLTDCSPMRSVCSAAG